jgi:hypothetical protein
LFSVTIELLDFMKYSWFLLVVCSFVAVTFFSELAYAAWSGPPYNGVCDVSPCPPNGNVPAPLNIGAGTQSKNGFSTAGAPSGALGIPAIFTNWLNVTGPGASVSLQSLSTAPVPTTNSLYNMGGSLYFNGTPVGGTSQWTNVSGGINYSGGTVGIGAAVPQAPLDVQGQLSFSGNGGQSGTVNRIATQSNTGWMTLNSPTAVYLNNMNAAPVYLAVGGGNTVVGGTTGDQKLNVNGNIHIYANATSLGYVYSDGTNFGLLNNVGQWALYVPNNTNTVTVPGTLAAAAATVGGSAVCTANGANCPGETLASVTARGATTATAVTFNGAATFNAGPYTNDWYRVNTTGGIYWQGYGSGLYMSDVTWIRTLGGAGIWTNNGNIGTNGGLTIGYSGAGVGAGGAIIAGNVGIGTANPASKLEVAGNGAFNNSTSHGAVNVAGVGDGAQYAAVNLANLNNNSQVWGLQYRQDTGNFSIGYYPSGSTAFIIDTASNATFTGTLYVNTNIVAAGCIVYNGGTLGGCVSDARVKKDIQPWHRAGLAEVLKLNPVTYEYNGLGGMKADGVVRTGLIAQEVEKVAPALVGTESVKLNSTDTSPTEIKTVQYGDLTFALIEAVKELNANAEVQQKEIDALKAEVQALKHQ